MILFPAIDLKDGHCVRLERGEMAQATVFNDDPAAQARTFAGPGLPLSAHRRSQRRLRRQAGQRAGGRGDPGGRRRSRCSSAAASATSPPSRPWLGKGVRRVILGTVAVRDPALVREACRRFPGRVAVGIDARGGKVAVEGWAETSELAAIDLARRFEDAGVAAIIYTDIDRDGVLQGPQPAGHRRAGARHLDPGHRLGRPRRPRRRQGAAAARVCYAGRRHRRPRPLRRPARSPGGAGAAVESTLMSDPHGRRRSFVRARPGAVRRHSDRA